MRKSISTLALGAMMVAAPAAFAAGGHMGGMGGMGAMGGGGTHSTLSAPTTSSSMAPTNPNTRSGKALGQPGDTCQNASNYPANTPGNSFNAPGSAFNPNGKSGSVYAGSQPQNSNNSASVAQYDVGCYRGSANH
jgi:hypothetical protein